jgi:serine/threonine-protein kinase RsbW
MPVASMTPAQCARPVPPGAAPGLRWCAAFPGQEREARQVRRWLASLLPDCEARDDVTSVATELATNAIRHTASGRGGRFIVEITWDAGNVRVAVADGGAPTGPHLAAGGDDEHGRGLILLAGLASQAGVLGDSRGRVVWADVPWAAGVAPDDWYEPAISAGRASLAGRFATAPAWFGRATQQWWALARGELVAASSARALAVALGPVLDCLLPGDPGVPAAVGLARPARPRGPELPAGTAA